MTDDTTPRIEERENAMLLARNVPVLRDADGSELEAKPVRGLCRCGQSKNKPFCDGSHKEAGFESAHADVSGKDRVYTYDGKQVTVHFNKLLCSHAAECGKRAGHIFNTAQKPWVQPDNGSIEDIREVVANCPSGALRFSEPGGEAQAITSDEVSVSVERNGPYRVRNVAIEADYWADGQTPAKYVLCRCGMSKNKPFCDGSHRDEGWRDGD